MSRSLHPASILASFALFMTAGLAAPALAALPDQRISGESGFPRRWHAGRSVTPYSTVNMRYGNLHTTIPIVGWSGVGPAISLSLHHDSASAQSVTTVPATSGADMGKGWVHSYGVTLMVDANTATLVESDGSVRQFYYYSSAWHATTGFYDMLTDMGTDGWKLTDKDQTYRQFYPDGRLQQIVDSAGNEVDLTYGTAADAPLMAVTDASGSRSLTFDYNTNGQLVTITAPLDGSTNRVWTLNYTTNGDLNHVYSPIDANSNGTTSIAYDGSTNGLIHSVTDPNGHAATFTYTTGKVTTVTDPSPFSGQTQTFTWNTPAATNFNNVYTDRKSNSWTYNFSYAATNAETIAGELLRVTDPLTHFNAWVYASHEKTTHRDANSNTRLYDYSTDGMMDLISDTDPNTNTTTYSYDTTFHKVVEKSEPSAGSPHVTTHQYDPVTGLLTCIIDATTNHQTDFAYYGGGDHPEWTGLLKTRTDRRGVTTTYDYDDYGQLANQYVDSDGETALNLHSVYAYNKAGFLLSMTDPRGTQTVYTYDRQGRMLTSTVDPGSSPHLALLTTNVYDAGGRRTSATNPRGTVTSYAYDALNRLTSVTADVGGIEAQTLYDYDSNGNRESMTDAEGNTTVWTYDAANRADSMTDQETNVTTYGYDDAGNRTTVTDANTHITLTTYDKLNRVAKVEVDQAGLDLTTQYFYADGVGGGGGCGCAGGAGKGLIRHMIDADGKHTWYTYDELDRRILEIRKDGDTNSDADTNDAVTQYGYDPEGHVTVVRIDPDGLNLTTAKAYDNAGRLSSSIVDAGTSNLNLTTTYDYDSNGNPLHVTNAAGNVAENTYDAANRRISTTDSIGLVESLTLDENGNVTQRVTHDATTDRATDYAFDALDRMETQTDPLGKVTSYTYTNVGKIYTITDANSHITTYTYDGNNRTMQVENPLSDTVGYEYDGVGNLLTQTASNGGGDPQVTTYHYDGANRCDTETYPDDEAGVNVRSFTYNGAGQVQTRTDQNGDVTTYTYDDLHRLTQRSYTINSGVTYPAAQPPDTFSYDLAGRMLTAVKDANTTVLTSADVDTFTYNAGGAVTQFNQGGLTIDYAYVVDANTSRRTITYNGGMVIQENADKRGRIETIIDVSTNTPVTLAVNTYDQSDHLLGRDFGNATEAVWTYDAAGRVNHILHEVTGGSPLVEFNYVRDAVGNPTCRENLLTSNMSEHYTYDDGDRLTLFQRGDVSTHGAGCSFGSATSNTGVLQEQAWTLDSLGNWSTNGTTVNSSSATETRSHNKANEITDITTDGTTYPTYDDNGNITNDGTFIYSYDAENRLTRVQNQGYDTISESYYDALGRRVRKVVTNSDNDGDYRYLWNPDWQLMNVYVFADSELKPRQRLVHAGSPAAWYPQLGVGGGRAYIDDHICIYVPGGMGGGRKYFHTDAQYNTQMVTDASSNIAASYVLSAYGLVETITQPGMGGLGSYATNNAMIHQGLPYDAETGSYYNRNRIYGPNIGRFLQRDIIGYSATASLYESLFSSPGFVRDPNGTDPPSSMGKPSDRIGVGSGVFVYFYLTNCEHTCALNIGASQIDQIANEYALSLPKFLRGGFIGLMNNFKAITPTWVLVCGNGQETYQNGRFRRCCNNGYCSGPTFFGFDSFSADVGQHLSIKFKSECRDAPNTTICQNALSSANAQPTYTTLHGTTRTCNIKLEVDAFAHSEQIVASFSCTGLGVCCNERLESELTIDHHTLP